MYEEPPRQLHHFAVEPGAAPEGVRPAMAALASAILPGLGQLMAGKRRRGLILLGITVAILTAIGGLWFSNKLWVLTLTVRPTALLWFLILNAIGLAFRGYAAVDAYLAAGGREGHRSGAPIAASAALLLLTAGAAVFIPHAGIAYYDLVQYDLITSVFSGDTASGDDTTTTTMPPEDTTPGTSGGVIAVGGTATTSTSSTTTSTTTTTLPPTPPWEGVGRYNVLVIGADAGIGRRGLRTDTMIVTSIDMETGWVSMFSIPRNLAEIPLPADLDAFECDCFPQIANELYDFGVTNPELFPQGKNPGARALMVGLGELLDIPIHNYAMVNLAGFVEVVDAVGGVTINVTRAVHDDAYPSEDGTTEVIDIPVGVQKMDGHTALAYARSRRESDDYNRMGRQRCVLEALATGTDPASLLLNFPRIANVLKQILDTDIPIDQLPDLLRVATKVDTELIVSVRIIPPVYNLGFTKDRYPAPNLPLIREHVQTALTLAPADAIVALGLDPLTEACG